MAVVLVRMLPPVLPPRKQEPHGYLMARYYSGTASWTGGPSSLDAFSNTGAPIFSSQVSKMMGPFSSSHELVEATTTAEGIVGDGSGGAFVIGHLAMPARELRRPHSVRLRSRATATRTSL